MPPIVRTISCSANDPPDREYTPGHSRSRHVGTRRADLDRSISPLSPVCPGRPRSISGLSPTAFSTNNLDRRSAHVRRTPHRWTPHHERMAESLVPRQSAISGLQLGFDMVYPNPPAQSLESWLRFSNSSTPRDDQLVPHCSLDSTRSVPARGKSLCLGVRPQQLLSLSA